MIRRGVTFILNDPFLRNNAIFFFGSILVAFLNYLYHPILSRLMSVSDFGEVQTIISLFYISGLVLSIFRMMAVNIVTNNTDSEHQVSRLYTLSLVIHLPMVLILAFGSAEFSKFFLFQSHWSFIPFALFIFVNVPYTFYNGVLQGKQKFIALSISNIIVAFGKLLVAVILVVLGARVFGAVAALFVSVLISLFYSLWQTKYRIRITNLKNLYEPFKSELNYSLLVFAAMGFVTFLYSADVLVVKRLFTGDDAGLYSGVATIARIIYFATSSIAGVLLSHIKMGQDAKSENRKNLKKSLYLFLIVAGSALIIFSIFPKLIIKILIGSKYENISYLLPLLSIYLFLTSLVNLFFSYFLALRKKALFAISIVSFIVTALAISVNNANLSAVIEDFIIGSSCALILLGVRYKSLFSG